MPAKSLILQDRPTTTREPMPQARDRIRVCHMVVRGTLDGAQRSMLDICRRLDPQRFERHVVCRAEGPLTDELRQLDITYHLIAALDRPVHPLRDAAALWQLRRLCRRQAFDIVHTHTSKAGLLGRLAARSSGVPGVVHHVRGFAFHEFSPWYARRLLSEVERWAGRWCDRVVFVNHEERHMSIAHGWLPAEKCSTVYNGADLDLFDPQRNTSSRAAVRRELQASHDEVLILFSGRLSAQKQPLILPEIAAALDRHRPQARWRILVAGTGPLQAELRAATARYGAAHRVTLLGWRRDVTRLFHAADIVLLPSLWEGLPRVLIEAQAAALPAVASDVKGNREVVTDATGFLCDPRDAASYVEPLARLLDDVALRQQFGTTARHRAEAEFDADANMARIIALYADMLPSDRKGDIERASVRASTVSRTR